MKHMSETKDPFSIMKGSFYSEGLTERQGEQAFIHFLPMLTSAPELLLHEYMTSARLHFLTETNEVSAGYHIHYAGRKQTSFAPITIHVVFLGHHVL